MNSAPFMAGGYIAVPGAWLINGGGASFPVFNSIANLNPTNLELQFKDIADTVLLMPGFRIELWQHGDYTGTKLLDAYNSTTQPKYYNISDNYASSLKLYNLAGILIGLPTSS